MNARQAARSRFIIRKFSLTACLAGFTALGAMSARAQDAKFIEPTHEELAMTSLPGYPGVSAVVLNREFTTKDDMHSDIHYERIKILTEEGKKYANVELQYLSTTSDFTDWGLGDQKTVDDIQGRTIHPDGTVVPFTGKPYLKVLEKGNGFKYQAKVFTLPDVTVGSIIEYRYATRISDNWFESPVWLIQGPLYVKSAHYMWYPTSHPLQDEDGEIRTITWFPILPKGADIVHHEIPAIGSLGLPQYTYELTVKDVPPLKEEEFMPPISNFSYRVYFNFISEHDGNDFWKSKGKTWSKRVNSFSNPNGDLRTATQAIIAGATSSDQKLRAIYGAVMALENTDYTRQHEERENKAAGLGKVKNASDVLTQKRGSSTEITELFIGMARAAGFQADAMLVPDRSRNLFIPQYLNIGRQFNDLVAVVNVDGKEQFFDPGERYCAYGHLAWQHTFVQGLRQKGSETAFDTTPGDGYQANVVARVANLKMDDSGHITGRIDVAYSGAAALRWRHAALRGDDESLKHELRTSLEEMIPRTLEVRDVNVQGLTDPDHDLKVTYEVQGTLGTATGKRLLLPADIFLANEKATFPHDKRDVAVDFHYPQRIVDAQRINFPATFSVEAAPSNAKYNFAKYGGYGMTVEQAPTSFTTRREYVFGEVYVLPQDYPQLRTFYSQFEANDQQSVILKSAAPITTASNAPAAN